MVINVQFSKTDMRVDAEFSQSTMRFDTAFSALQQVTIQKDADPYTGEYEITPTVDGQTIPTAQKFMTDDMIIKAIPFYNVSNTSGGSTVYIAKEL